MQEDLLGYLLGALEPDEMRRVERMLREDPEAQAELAELERMLEPLNQEPDVVEHPAVDLVARTLDCLPPLPSPTDPVDNQSTSPNDSAVQHASPVGRAMGPVPMSASLESGEASSWTWRDWVTSAVAACVVLALALPMMVEGRFTARKQACQDHLRELGMAMTQFVHRNAQSRLPSVESDGHQAFAGVYAPKLHEAGLLDDASQTLCPSLEPNEFWRVQGIRVNDSYPDQVTLRELDDAAMELSLVKAIPSDVQRERRGHDALERLTWMQRTAGGHYAYTLGVRDDGHFESPRFQGRSSFAVMSDAAVSRMIASAFMDDSKGKMRSSTMSSSVELLSHGGRGINLLYEDGRVQFIPAQSLRRIPDHPLVNHDGRPEAGVNVDDASLAPSWQPPFVQARQR